MSFFRFSVTWALVLSFILPAGLLPATQAKADGPPPIITKIRFNGRDQLAQQGYPKRYKSLQESDILQDHLLLGYDGAGGWGVAITEETAANIKEIWKDLNKNKEHTWANYENLYRTLAKETASSLREAYAYIPPETRESIERNCSGDKARKGRVSVDDYAQCLTIDLLSDTKTIFDVRASVKNAKDLEEALKLIELKLGKDSPILPQIAELCKEDKTKECVQQSLAGIHSTLDRALGGMQDALGALAWMEGMKTWCVKRGTKQIKSREVNDPQYKAIREMNQKTAKACESPGKRYVKAYITDDVKTEEKDTNLKNADTGKKLDWKQVEKSGIGLGVDGIAFKGYLFDVKEGKLAKKSDKTAGDVAPRSSAPAAKAGGAGGKGLKGKGGSGSNKSVETTGIGHGKGNGIGDGVQKPKRQHSGPLTIKDIDEAKEDVQEKAQTAEEALAELIELLAGTKKSDPRKVKELVDAVYDNGFIAKLNGTTLKCTAKLASLDVCKEGEPFDFFGAYDGGSSSAWIGVGGGQKPKCPKWLDNGFCAGGSKYDISHYKLAYGVSSDANGASLYKHAIWTDTPNTELGSTNLAQLERQVYEINKSALQEDLVAFLGDLWIDKYIEAAKMHDPENADQHLPALQAKIEGLSCLSPASKMQLMVRKKVTEKKAQQLVGLLSQDHFIKKRKDGQFACSDGTTAKQAQDCSDRHTVAKKERYASNLSNAAQCMNVLMDDFLALRDELGLDIQTMSSLEKQEAEAHAETEKQLGKKGTLVSHTAKSILEQMLTGPTGVLWHALFSKLPIYDPSKYAKKPCSMFAIAANEPVYRVGDRIYDPMVEPVPDEIKNSRAERVARAVVCNDELQRLHNTTEQLEEILSAYPALGLTGDDGKESASHKERSIFMGYKKLVNEGESARVKAWKEKGGRGPCMGAFLKDPRDLESGRLDASKAAQERALGFVRSNHKKTLDSYLKELGKVCDGSDVNQEALAQTIGDAALMERFYSCEKGNLGHLLNYYQDDGRSMLDIMEGGEGTTSEELEAKFREMNEYDKTLAEATHDSLAEKQCKERKDMGPLVCYMWSDEKIAERRREMKDSVKSGAINLALLGMELTGAKHLQGALKNKLLSMGAKKAILAEARALGGSLAKRTIANSTWRREVAKKALGTVKTYGREIVSGGGFGLGLHWLTGKDTDQEISKAETTLALAQAGVHSDVLEIQKTAQNLEELLHEGGLGQTFIDGAVQGVLFSLAMRGHQQAAQHKVDPHNLDAIKAGQDIDAFSESQKGTDFHPANETFGQARARAKRNNDNDLVKTLDRLEKQVNALLSKLPKPVRDYLSKLPIKSLAAHLQVFGLAAFENNQTLKNALHKAATNAKNLRNAIREVFGGDVADNLTDDQLLQMARNAPVVEGIFAKQRADRAQREAANQPQQPREGQSASDGAPKDRLEDPLKAERDAIDAELKADRERRRAANQPQQPPEGQAASDGAPLENSGKDLTEKVGPFFKKIHSDLKKKSKEDIARKKIRVKAKFMGEDGKIVEIDAHEVSVTKEGQMRLHGKDASGRAIEINVNKKILEIAHYYGIPAESVMKLLNFDDLSQLDLFMKLDAGPDFTPGFKRRFVQIDLLNPKKGSRPLDGVRAVNGKALRAASKPKPSEPQIVSDLVDAVERGRAKPIKFKDLEGKEYEARATKANRATDGSKVSIEVEIKRPDGSTARSTVELNKIAEFFGEDVHEEMVAAKSPEDLMLLSHIKDLIRKNELPKEFEPKDQFMARIKDWLLHGCPVK